MITPTVVAFAAGAFLASTIVAIGVGGLIRRVDEMAIQDAYRAGYNHGLQAGAQICAPDTESEEQAQIGVGSGIRTLSPTVEA